MTAGPRCIVTSARHLRSSPPLVTATGLLATYLFNRVCMHALNKADVEENVHGCLDKAHVSRRALNEEGA